MKAIKRCSTGKCYSQAKSDNFWPPDVMYTQEIKGRENLSTGLSRRAPVNLLPQKVQRNDYITKASTIHDAAYKAV